MNDTKSTDAKKLQASRTKIFRDLYSGIIPERFPIFDSHTLDFMLDYTKQDVFQIVYNMNPDDVTEVFEQCVDIHYGETLSAAGRNPSGLMFKQSKVNVMSKTGMVQHPETSGFEADEYDEFIEHPYDFSLEKILPRLNPGLDKDPINRSVNFTKYVLSQIDYIDALGIASSRIAEKYGFYTAPKDSSKVQPMPFDFLADFCRGFTKIPLDLRRCPDKVEAACEALVPYLLWRAVNPVTSIEGQNSIMTHMAPFLREKDFAKFYWPTFYKMVHIIAERGQACYIFLEGNWERYIDFLQDLPQGTRLHMEYGDPQKFKDKLGKKMVLGGFYPITLLKTGTKQECIDKGKEIVDVLAPGGNFEFRFDKSALRAEDIKIENYRALMEWLLDNSKYDNAGQTVTTSKKEDSIKKFSHEYPEFKSKYIVTFDELKKEFPPVNERAEKAMRSSYDKYSDIVQPYNDVYSLFG